MTNNTPVKDYSWYPPLAMRTCKDMPTLKDHIAHMGLGLGSEYLEYLSANDITNQNEEVGDMCWYVSGICNSLNISFIPIKPKNWNMDEIVGDIVSICKKHFVYGVDINIEKLTELCQNLLFILGSDFPELEQTLDSILKDNIEKLKVRYPEYYTDQLAVERLDKTNTD
jgi:hypothetical protein